LIIVGGNYRSGIPLAEYGITQEMLTPGKHTLQVVIGEVVSNALTITAVAMPSFTLAQPSSDEQSGEAIITDEFDASAAINDGSLKTPHMQIHNITSVDGAAVLSVLETLLGEQLNVRLAIDPKTENLVVMALPADHAAIKAFLDELQRGADVGGGANGATPGSIKTELMRRFSESMGAVLDADRQDKHAEE